MRLCSIQALEIYLKPGAASRLISWVKTFISLEVIGVRGLRLNRRLLMNLKRWWTADARPCSMPIASGSIMSLSTKDLIKPFPYPPMASTSISCTIKHPSSRWWRVSGCAEQNRHDLSRLLGHCSKSAEAHDAGVVRLPSRNSLRLFSSPEKPLLKAFSIFQTSFQLKRGFCSSMCQLGCLSVLTESSTVL
jgi:hypothetical protein